MTSYEIQLDCIFGNDDETQVLARVTDRERSSLTVRISYDSLRPLSLTSRITACFYESDVACPDETFEDRSAMRAALRDAISQVWPDCIHAVSSPEAVIDLVSDKDGRVRGCIKYETTLYQEYLQALLPADAVLASGTIPLLYRQIEHGDLITVRGLPGRGTSVVVRRLSEHGSTSLYVFKGLAFGDFLASHDDFMHERNVFYNAIKTVSTVPPHPNILPPPQMVVVAKSLGIDNQALVCGTLYPFMAHGTLDDQAMRCKSRGIEIPLRDQARWCLQLSSALAHTHHVAHTYHMDIKPSNILIDDDRNAILIDWEQSGAPTCTLAPEANGEWDIVDEIRQPGAASKLVYKRYQGPERVNNPHGRPEWNVYPEWSKCWPKAWEAAEVFSLGRTMWMLLQKVPQADIQYLDPRDIVVEWGEEADGVPDTWKAIVMRCLENDPNQRIGFADLERFWSLTKHFDIEKKARVGPVSWRRLSFC